MAVLTLGVGPSHTLLHSLAVFAIEVASCCGCLHRFSRVDWLSAESVCSGPRFTCFSDALPSGLLRCSLTHSIVGLTPYPCTEPGHHVTCPYCSFIARVAGVQRPAALFPFFFVLTTYILAARSVARLACELPAIGDKSRDLPCYGVHESIIPFYPPVSVPQLAHLPLQTRSYDPEKGRCLQSMVLP